MTNENQLSPTPFQRILPIEILELRVDVRIVLMQRLRILEKDFGDHREEFHRVCGGIRIDRGVMVMLQSMSQIVEGPA